MTLKQALLGRQPKLSTKGDFGIAHQNRFAFLNPSLYCIYLALLSSLIVCLLKCEPMFKTLRAMFSLSVGEGKQSLFTLIYIFYITLKIYIYIYIYNKKTK